MCATTASQGLSLGAVAKQISHDFSVGEEELKKQVLSFSYKMQPAFKGPYQITWEK